MRKIYGFLKAGLPAMGLVLVCIPIMRPSATYGDAAEIKLEAEHFEIVSGWRVAGPEEGYFPSRPNEWSGGKLIADPGTEPAEAVKRFAVPRDGEYHLWVHYESPYGFDASFSVAIRQDGATVVEEPFGAPDQLKRFPFRGWQVQGPWHWHNTDLVFQRLSVNLKAGPTDVVLRKIDPDPPTHPSAARVVDLLYLTDDLSVEPGNSFSWNPRRQPDIPVPIIYRFTRPVFVRLRVDEQAPRAARVHINIQNHNPFTWGHSGPEADVFIARHGVMSDEPETGERSAAGETTNWLPIDLPRVLPIAFRVTSDVPAVLEINHRTSDENAVAFSLAPDAEAMIVVGVGQTRYEERVLRGAPAIRYADYLERTTQDVAAYDVPGKRAFRYGLLGTFPDSLDGFDLRRLMAASGFTGYKGMRPTAAVFGPEGDAFGFNRERIYGLGHFMNHFTATRGAPEQRRTRPFWEGDDAVMRDHLEGVVSRILRPEGLEDVAVNLKLLEERWAPPLGYLRTLERPNTLFREYLRGEGIDPRDVLPPETLRKLLAREAAIPAADLWDAVELGTGSQEEARRSPVLFYHSRRFLGRLMADQCARAVRVAEDVFGPETLVNAGSTYPPTSGLTTRDHFALYRQRGVTSYCGGVSWNHGGTPGYVGPQTCAFEGPIARALSKYHGGPMGNYLIADPNRGYKPEDVELISYALASHGFQWWDYYEIHPWGECTMLDHPEMFKAIKRVSHALGAVEDRLFEAQVVPGRVAIGWSNTRAIWDLAEPREVKHGKGPMLFTQERQHLYLWLRHLGIPVEIVDEQDMVDGYLDDYRMYIQVSDYIRRDAAEALKAWVADGGILFSVAGGGLLDEYGRPLDTLNDVYGIRGASLEQWQQCVRPKLELLHTSPVEKIRFEGRTAAFPIFGYQQTFEPEEGTVFGRYLNGQAAALTHTYGDGRSLILGGLTGLAYLHGAFPMKPYGRGGDDLSQYRYPDYNVRMRDLFANMLARIVDLDEIRGDVLTDEPLVEANLQRHPETGDLSVTLVNYSGTPIPELTVRLRADRLPDVTDATGLWSRGRVARVGDDLTITLPVDKFEFLTLKQGQ